jgi:hypothetical protein
MVEMCFLPLLEQRFAKFGVFALKRAPVGTSGARRHLAHFSRVVQVEERPLMFVGIWR